MGKALATVLDRKTGYGAANGEYAGFRADIASATDYYPFGMEMRGRTINNSAYRFGFNTQEKIDEIAGKGNHTTSEFWEYSPRIARRWNLDPVDQGNISNYAAFRNSPLIFSDKLGNKPDWVYSPGKKSLLYDSEVTDDNSLKTLYPNSDYERRPDKHTYSEASTGRTFTTSYGGFAHYDDDPSPFGQILKQDQAFERKLSTIEKMDRLFSSPALFEPIYKIMAEWNPLPQNATKLASGITGRDFLIPASGDVFNKGAQMSTDKLSTTRRFILGADGAIGTFSMFAGGQSGLSLDLGLNAGADFLDNYQKAIPTNGRGGYFLKQTVMTVQTVINVHRSPANALSTFGM